MGILQRFYLLSNKNELSKWMISKNTIEIINDIIFTHGGISAEIIDTGLTITEINSIVRTNIRNNLTNHPKNDQIANLVFSRKSPFWYRGLVKDYKKVKHQNLDLILEAYNVKHIVVGHTIVGDEISADFNGKIIRVDIKHPKEKFTGKSQALLIENELFYKVNDSGEKSKLVF